MLLTIDVGNTQTVLGLFDGTTLTHHWRISTNDERTSDEMALLVSELLRLRGVRVTPDEFDLDKLPPHLRITFRVMDGAGNWSPWSTTSIP